MKLKITWVHIITLIAFLSLINGASAWYNTGWDNRIPVTIDNTGNVSLTNYVFDISIPSGINESSIRVVNDSTDTVVPHWAENVSGGVCYGLWFNGSVGSGISTDYYIYYGNDAASSTSSYNNTFGHGIVLDMPLTTRYADGNTMIDRSPYRNNGTNRGGAIVGADSTSFDGDNDFITHDEIAFNDGIPHTFSVRLKWDPIGTNEYVIPFGKPGNIYSIYLLSTFSTRFKYRSSVDIYTITGVNTSLLYDNNWHLLTWKVETNKKVTVYIDGVYNNDTIISDTGMIYSAIANGYSISYLWEGNIANVYIYNTVLSPTQITQLYEQYNTTPSTSLGAAQSPTVNISLYSKYPETLFTNYTGFLSASYIVETDFPLNLTSLAFLMGMNYTLTDDYHSYLKVPANDIAFDGIYRAHNRNTSPLMAWESNDTITEGNVWKWAGGDINDFWINNKTINSTHTWINMTGVASNVFPSMFYLNRDSMYQAPKTGIEINKGQGVIFKIWDLEQFRSRSYDYYLSLYFDTQLEATPDSNIDIWYCNDSFDPLTDDPCLVCDYKDTWTYGRWMDHESWQPRGNVSYAKPLQIHAGTATCPSSPTEVDYIYLQSDTVSSKSYILNATNSDPGICNVTYAETETMWLRDEVAGTNSPLAYTPSFFNTFTRDYLEFTHHIYVANDQGVWGHSDYVTHPIGISDVSPTFTKYNYYWWNGTKDYNMNNSYEESFWINATYGYDPDNGASLTHVLSLYDDDYNFIAFINSSLIGNQTDEDIWFNMSEYTNKYSGDYYMFKIVSTDNEGSTSVSWSNVFQIPRESWFANTIDTLKGFPAAMGNIFTAFLSYLPLFVGILISGFLIMVCVGIFSKFKRW